MTRKQQQNNNNKDYSKIMSLAQWWRVVPNQLNPDQINTPVLLIVGLYVDPSQSLP